MTNEMSPPRIKWFIPDGTVFKWERLRDATLHETNWARRLRSTGGSSKHFYEIADVADANGKHYLATAFVVYPSNDTIRDDQYPDARMFNPPFPTSSSIY